MLGPGGRAVASLQCPQAALEEGAREGGSSGTGCLGTQPRDAPAPLRLCAPGTGRWQPWRTLVPSLSWQPSGWKEQPRQGPGI